MIPVDHPLVYKSSKFWDKIGLSFSAKMNNVGDVDKIALGAVENFGPVTEAGSEVVNELGRAVGPELGDEVLTGILGLRVEIGWMLGMVLGHTLEDRDGCMLGVALDNVLKDRDGCMLATKLGGILSNSDGGVLDGRIDDAINKAEGGELSIDDGSELGSSPDRLEEEGNMVPRSDG